jgi:hypothetical protein
MAIYKNREVYIQTTPVRSTPTDNINVMHRDGSHETVPVSQVTFTEDEKNQLVKNNPGKFDNVMVAPQEDLDSVRLGVTPPSDPSYKEQAMRQVHDQRAKELTDKNMEMAKKEAEKQAKDKPETLVVPAPVNQVKVTSPKDATDRTDSRPVAKTDSKLPWVK